MKIQTTLRRHTTLTLDASEVRKACREYASKMHHIPVGSFEAVTVDEDGCEITFSVPMKPESPDA